MNTVSVPAEAAASQGATRRTNASKSGVRGQWGLGLFVTGQFPITFSNTMPIKTRSCRKKMKRLERRETIGSIPVPQLARNNLPIPPPPAASTSHVSASPPKPVSSPRVIQPPQEEELELDADGEAEEEDVDELEGGGEMEDDLLDAVDAAEAQARA